MWRDHPSVAFGYVGPGLDVVESGIDDFWSIAPLLWHGARAHAEATLAGETVPDGEVRRLRQHYRELERRAERSVPAVRVVLSSYVGMCAAEDQRARGVADPDTWAAVADQLVVLRQPYPEAYSRLRSAEVRLGLRPRSAEGADDLVRAHRIASGMRAEPLLARIRDLAARARVTAGRRREALAGGGDGDDDREPPRRAHPPRAGRPGRRRRGADEPGDRRTAVHQREDRRRAPQPDLRQARRAQSCAGQRRAPPLPASGIGCSAPSV